MLNYLWAGMILAGIVFGAFNGRMQDITTAALDSSKEAVTLCITMIGVMAFWTGIMEIASRAGIIQMAARKMRPLLRFLFPNLTEGHKAEEHISTNFIANVLGLGWAATPAGLRAWEELSKLEVCRRNNRVSKLARPRGVARKELCPFLSRNRRCRDSGYSGKHRCGSDILQDNGPERKSVTFLMAELLQKSTRNRKNLL